MNINTKSSPEGLWLIANGHATIRMTPEADGLSGYLDWIIEGGLMFDKHNPDRTKRDTPLTGMKIFWGFRQQNETEWTGGKVYKADEGHIYNARLKMLPDGRMLVRGYWGIPLLGKSQILSPASPADYPKRAAI